MATGSAISQNIGLVVGGAAILVVAVLAGIVISRTDTSPPDPVKTEVSKPLTGDPATSVKIPAATSEATDKPSETAAANVEGGDASAAKKSVVASIQPDAASTDAGASAPDTVIVTATPAVAPIKAQHLIWFGWIKPGPPLSPANLPQRPRLTLCWTGK